MWNPDEFGDRVRALAHAALDHWPDDGSDLPPAAVRRAVDHIRNASETELRSTLEEFVGEAPQAIGTGEPWWTDKFNQVQLA